MAVGYCAVEWFVSSHTITSALFRRITWSFLSVAGKLTYPAKATNNAKGAQCWQTNNKTTQPSGAAVPEEADARQRRAFASSGFSLPK